MAGAGEGDGNGKGASKLESRIYCIKYTLFCFNIILWMLGAAIFGLAIWIRAEPGFNEWIIILKIQEYYIGIYILLISSVLIMIVSFVGCGAALMENTAFLTLFVISQIGGFIIGLAGTAVLLDFSTYDSKIQPLIRRTITEFINNPQHEYSKRMLTMIQEEIGCCGADGPTDYMFLRKPLPAECRDTVTGNAFFYGCVEELTWYLEEKSGWLAGIVMVACLFHVINTVMSMILIQAVRKEENDVQSYKPGR
ncbi:tetraspanin 2A [Arctopsyche grandis]|uniref:tetraspanin 2A n=1 Tax=Arctopsyche grandis TaxID=121162 RepID=UPI00406D801A